MSPDRILAAAALEFAERGFAGARVDRIARRARINKAMLYYHFRSKQGLYHALLRQMFAGAAARLQAIGARDLSAVRKVEEAIAVMAEYMAEHPHFPAIMLREIAESGAHLDAGTLKTLASVPMAMAGIVKSGIGSGDLRPIHPVAAYFTLFAPILVYLAGTPIRKALTSRHLINMTSLPPDVFVHQHQESVRREFVAPRTSHLAPRTRRDV